MDDLDPKAREALWARAFDHVEHTFADDARPLVPTLGGEALEEVLAALDGREAHAPERVLELVARGLAGGQVEVAHPRYLGLSTAAPAAIAIAAGAMAAASDPQLATRRHAPFAVELEDRLLRRFGARFGWAAESTSGTFTSGGAEASLVATCAALAHVHPSSHEGGLRALRGDPVVYVSTEGHPTIARAARIAGLGARNVRAVAVDPHHRMKPSALRDAIGRDRARGALPTMIVATVGTTSSGAIDPLETLAEIAERAGAWLHADAAWGGMLALVPACAGEVKGIARADSIAFDPHKALAMPLGCGMLLTRHAEALGAAFHERPGYMPRSASTEPYARGLAWSRRSHGVPLAALLATLGDEGLARALGAQIALGDRLEEGLRREGFAVRRSSRLPVVCVTDETREDGASGAFLEGLARAVIASGAGWISVTRFADGKRALRACVTNHRTTAEDVDRVVAALGTARRAA